MLADKAITHTSPPTHTGGDVLDSRQYSDAQEAQAEHSSCPLP